MPWHADPPAPSPLRRQLLMAYLAAAAVAAHLLESTLPGLGPLFKPGLANVFGVVAFFHLGWRAALGVTLVRVVAGSLALGTFLSPTFVLSLSGALGAMALMGLAGRLSHWLGPVGISLLASLGHMGSQVAVAAGLLVGHGGLLLALPWLLMGSWLTGILNGLVAFTILERLSRQHPPAPAANG